MLPNDWQPVEVKNEIYFMAVDPTATQALWIELYASEGNSMDDLLNDLSAMKEFQSVQGVYFNGVPFVTYSTDELLGYATMNGTQEILLFIKLTPLGADGLEALATQIMSTLSPLNAASQPDLSKED